VYFWAALASQKVRSDLIFLDTAFQVAVIFIPALTVFEADQGAFPDLYFKFVPVTFWQTISNRLQYGKGSRPKNKLNCDAVSRDHEGNICLVFACHANCGIVLWEKARVNNAVM